MAVVNLLLTFDSFVGATDGVRFENLLLLLLEQSLGFGHGKRKIEWIWWNCVMMLMMMMMIVESEISLEKQRRIWTELWETEEKS